LGDDRDCGHSRLALQHRLRRRLPGADPIGRGGVPQTGAAPSGRAGRRFLPE
jgi:hypothetical protein